MSKQAPNPIMLSVRCSLSFFSVRGSDGRKKEERKSGRGKDGGGEGERKKTRTWEREKGRWIGIRDKRWEKEMKNNWGRYEREDKRGKGDNEGKMITEERAR